jgi:hypothetical protein
MKLLYVLILLSLFSCTKDNIIYCGKVTGREIQTEATGKVTYILIVSIDDREYKRVTDSMGYETKLNGIECWPVAP